MNIKCSALFNVALLLQTRPNLSRIQVCCEGYERNIHNFHKCDPICRKECINGICIAPDQCACYPDHVTNLAGYCVPTCPIGTIEVVVSFYYL